MSQPGASLFLGLLRLGVAIVLINLVSSANYYRSLYLQSDTTIASCSSTARPQRSTLSTLQSILHITASMMPPRKFTEATAEAPSPQQIDHQTRSAYGDGHAATNHALLVAHAVYLGTAGVIDEQMVSELTKPMGKMREQGIKYSEQYLAAHPDYTGENTDAIPTMQTALKHQRDRDAAQERLLADYRAGKIDIWGNRVNSVDRDTSFSGSSSTSDDSMSDSGTGNDVDGNGLPCIEEHTGDTTESADSSFMESSLTTLPNAVLTPSQRQHTLPSVSSLSQPELKFSSKGYHYRASRSVTPLTPLPGNATYEDLDYYKAAALCRQRGIPSGGNLQEVRNTLVKDDTNVKLGLEREKTSTHHRKGYKAKAPAESEQAGG